MLTRYQGLAIIAVIASGTAGPQVVAGCSTASPAPAPALSVHATSKAKGCCPICGSPVLTFGGKKKCIGEGKHEGILNARKGGSGETGKKNLRPNRRGRPKNTPFTPKPTETSDGGAGE